MSTTCQPRRCPNIIIYKNDNQNNNNNTKKMANLFALFRIVICVLFTLNAIVGVDSAPPADSNNNNNNVNQNRNDGKDWMLRDSEPQPKTPANRTIVNFDFTVLEGRNVSSSSSSSSSVSSPYFCVIELDATNRSAAAASAALSANNNNNNNNSPSSRIDYLPLHDMIRSDLCRPFLFSQSTNADAGAFIFNHSDACSTTKQIDTFAAAFPRSRSLIFSIKCDLNLRNSFNLTTEYVREKRFSISLLSDSEVSRLLHFEQIGRLPADPESRWLTYRCVTIIFSIAVCCVVVGAYWSGEVRYKCYIAAQRQAALRDRDSTREAAKRSPADRVASPQDAFAELTLGSVLFAVTITIVVLLSLYFFYKYIVFVFIAIFMLFSAISVYACVEAAAIFTLPRAVTRSRFSIPFASIIARAFLSETDRNSRKVSFRWIALPILAFAFSLPIAWFVTRHTSPIAWLLQDVLCAFFCVFQLRTLRLPSFKICCMLLGALFVYDIFFVFVTPLFTSSGISIMEYVATGGGGIGRNSLTEYRCTNRSERVEVLPLAVRVPRNIFGADPRTPADYCSPDGYSLLGLGDIIIPGILVAYCAAFDRIRRVPRRAYLLVSSLAYATGLVFSYIALIIMKIGQPALLYLVPCTIVSVILLAAARGELGPFWFGPEKMAPLDVDCGNGNVAASSSSSSSSGGTDSNCDASDVPLASDDYEAKKKKKRISSASSSSSSSSSSSASLTSSQTPVSVTIVKNSNNSNQKLQEETTAKDKI